MEKNFKKLEQKIFDKLETEISVNKFKKETKNPNRRFSLVKKGIAMIVSITAIGGTAIFAYNKIKEINYTNYGYSATGHKNDSVQEATENGYIEKLNSEYEYMKDIGCKINSYFISDNNVGLQLDFDFSNKKLEQNRCAIKFIIYDEDGNVYGKSYFVENIIRTLKERKYINDFYKKHNLNNKDDIASSTSYGSLYESENHVTYRILLSSSNNTFPKNKKLYVNIYDIGYNIMATDSKYDFKPLAKDRIEWNFEIDVSEKFYNRTSDKYNLKENVENFKLENMIVTNTQAIVTYSSNDIGRVKGIVDSNGNVYSMYSSSFLEDKYLARCSFNKKMETTPLYLRIAINGEIKDVELEKISE